MQKKVILVFMIIVQETLLLLIEQKIFSENVHYLSIRCAH